MANEQTKPAQRRRIGLRFGMRALLLGMAVLCCYFGYLAHQVQSRRAAIERIKELGGHVVFEYHRSEEGAIDLDRERPPATSWWQSLLPEELRVEAFSIHLEGTEAADKDMELISWLPEAKRLWLADTRVTNKSARHIASFSELEWLNISSTEIGDEAMPQIAKLQSLDILGLTNTKVTDQGLLALAMSESIGLINLRLTPVTAEGVQRFAAEGIRHRQLMVGGTLAEFLINSGGPDNVLLQE